jgi:hypothetical protein
MKHTHQHSPTSMYSCSTLPDNSNARVRASSRDNSLVGVEMARDFGLLRFGVTENNTSHKQICRHTIVLRHMVQIMLLRIRVSLNWLEGHVALLPQHMFTVWHHSYGEINNKAPLIKVATSQAPTFYTTEAIILHKTAIHCPCSTVSTTLETCTSQFNYLNIFNLFGYIFTSVINIWSIKSDLSTDMYAFCKII